MPGEGAEILFCDIEPETLGPDPRHLVELLDDSVRAVVLVHYAGIACDVDGIREVLRDRPGVAVIEDNAHGLFGRWRGEPLGSLGRFATLSFHETKNFVCGEGGALVVNDPADITARLDRVREGHGPAGVLPGPGRQVLLAGHRVLVRAVGHPRGVPARPARAARGDPGEAAGRLRRLLDGLTPQAEQLGIRLPVIPDYCEPAYHLFHVLLPDHDTRTRVMGELRGQGIQTTFHYVPLHDSAGGKRFTARPTECPVSTDVSGRLMRLPFHNNLTADDTHRVVEALLRSMSRQA